MTRLGVESDLLFVGTSEQLLGKEFYFFNSKGSDFEER